MIQKDVGSLWGGDWHERVQARLSGSADAEEVCIDSTNVAIGVDDNQAQDAQA